MAYSVGVEFVAESAMDLIPEAIPISISVPEGDSAIGSGETPLSNKQPENAIYADKEDLCPEAKQNAIESEPEGASAMGSSAEPPSTNVQPENASYAEKEDLCPEAKQNAIESEPEGASAMGSSAEPPSTNVQPENASYADKEDLCLEAKQNAIESEPEGASAMGSSAEAPSTNVQPENASYADKEDLCPEAKQNAIESEPEGASAMGSFAEPPSINNKQPKNAPNTKTVTKKRSPWCVCTTPEKYPKPVKPKVRFSSHFDKPEENASAFFKMEEDEFDDLFDIKCFDIPDLHPEYQSKKMDLFVIVSQLVLDDDYTYTLEFAKDIKLRVCPYEKIRRVKAKFSEIFNVFYEDMAVVFKGKFLSDARSLEYYYIKNQQFMHLLLEKPNPRFKQVFECFKRLGMDEETAWFSTRSYIVIESYKNKEMSNDEIILKGLEEVLVLDSDVDSNEELPPQNEPAESFTESDDDDDDD